MRQTEHWQKKEILFIERTMQTLLKRMCRSRLLLSIPVLMYLLTRRIAENGADYFYTGKLANRTLEGLLLLLLIQGQTIDLNSAIKKRNGIMTAHDLANYSAIIRTPANITYRNTRIFSTVAPSSGIVVLSVLKIFEGYNGSYPDSDPHINVTTHRLIEADRFGYGQR
jgi:gamma-glutamyltranspeptidase / glutathione hydrolase